MSNEFEYDVFLSYSSKDKEVVHALAERLKQDGLRVWLDAWVIQPGDSIPLKFQHGIEQSRTLLMCMSPAYFASDWGKLEHLTLLFRDPTNARRRFIPLLIGDCSPPDIIAQFARIDWRTASKGAYASLLAACQEVETTKPPAPRKLADQARMVLEGHANKVWCVAITPNGRTVVSGSWDKTLKIWDLATGRCRATLEGHASAVVGVAITPDGRTVVSGSEDYSLKVWDLPEPDTPIEEAEASRYTNAKVVLVGETGVGKTGLALRLCEDRWEVTESTHGMIISRLELPPDANAAGLEREVWLWDFAGQADYRLIHQLYMDEAALGVLVFNPQDSNPFEEMGHWEKALRSATIVLNPMNDTYLIYRLTSEHR